MNYGYFSSFFFFKCYPCFFVNCRTSSNCVNMQIQSAASPYLCLSVPTSSDPPPPPKGAEVLKTILTPLMLLPLMPPTLVTVHSNVYVGRVIVSLLTCSEHLDCFCLLNSLVSPQHTVMYCMSVLLWICFLHTSQFSLQTFFFFFFFFPSYMQRSLFLRSLLAKGLLILSERGH